MFRIEQSILQKIHRTKLILFHVIEIFKNKVPLPLSITLVIKTNLTLVMKAIFFKNKFEYFPTLI